MLGYHPHHLCFVIFLSKELPFISYLCIVTMYYHHENISKFLHINVSQNVCSMLWEHILKLVNRISKLVY